MSIHYYIQLEHIAKATFNYTNYKGETSSRQVTIYEIGFGNNEWHREPQWIMRAFDLEKMEFREFAMKDITDFQGVE